MSIEELKKINDLKKEIEDLENSLSTIEYYGKNSLLLCVGNTPVDSLARFNDVYNLFIEHKKKELSEKKQFFHSLKLI